MTFNPRNLLKQETSNLRFLLAVAFFLTGLLSGMTVDFLFFRKAVFAFATGIFLVASVFFTRTLIQEWGWLVKPHTLIPAFFLGLRITLVFLEFREV